MTPEKCRLQLIEILTSDTVRLDILRTVAELHLSDCWIGAGFIRNMIWDFQHGIHHPVEASDIDVIFFDSQMDSEFELKTQNQLSDKNPRYIWSVTNQAHIHTYNQHLPYLSCIDSISFWPETATSIAARLTSGDQLEVISPHGLSDLFQLILRPTSRDPKTLKSFNDRIRTRDWLKKWPRLTISS